MVAEELLSRVAGFMDTSRLGLFAMGCGFVVLTAVSIGMRRRMSHSRAGKTAKIESENLNLRADLDVLRAALRLDSQVLISWRSAKDMPVIDGDSDIIKRMFGIEQPLAFGIWLSSDQAVTVERAVDALKHQGQSFHFDVVTNGKRFIDIEGRAVGGRAILRLRDKTVERQDLAEVTRQHDRLKGEALGLRAMLDLLAQPIWLRDAEGKLTWVNEPYAFAVDADGSADVVTRQIEFVDQAMRQSASGMLAKGEMFQIRAPSIVGGRRRIFDIVETPLASGSLGYAVDVSDLESVRSDLQEQMESHVRTLDQLPTAVAIFNERQRLTFCNLSYRKLFQLDDTYLATQPFDSEILDRLRDARRLPEQADYKGWKRSLLDAYRSLETIETVWYLPNGRTLRVVINPNPQGGVTYLFDDVTAQIDMESSFNTLSRVQKETLDTLKEGVALFGQDGRLRLYNAAFGTLWAIDKNRLATRPHIDQIILLAHDLYADVHVWSQIKGTITSVHDQREGQRFRLERHDGTVLDCSLAPLPDGSTLVTFVDISASVHVERALTERNEALEQAAQLRENFVHHVSYQLRSPLTNVIGFTELLANGMAGPLNVKQGEYADHVMRSSKALMAIIDDILDLASFDRGDLALAIAEHDVRATIVAASEGLQDRLSETGIRLEIDVPDAVGKFWFDGKRVRQILFNLLSNAVGFSSTGQTVTVSAHKTSQALLLKVRDRGRGIPVDIIDRVFNRFEAHNAGTRHRGVGLGLSIVRALVERHGGTVSITSEPGTGTEVTCSFPVEIRDQGSSRAA